MKEPRAVEYGIDAYCRMMTDAHRVEPYVSALRAAIKPGDVVMDIGAGTGMMSMVACECGARKVYAIDPNPALRVARSEARTRGFEERIEFVEGMSTEFEPGERADVIVMDLRGVQPLYPGNIRGARDAATRLLKPGGTLIPVEDVVWVAGVECGAAHRRYVDQWSGDASRPWRSAVAANANNAYRVDLAATDVVTGPMEWARIVYGTTVDEHACAGFTLRCTRAATAHGLAVWFTARLHGDVGFSTAPGECGPIYGQLLLPFQDPVSVEEGDELECNLRTEFASATVHWAWSVRTMRGGTRIAEETHSTFNGMSLSADAVNALQSPRIEERMTSEPIEMTAPFIRSDRVLSAGVGGETVLLGLDLLEYFGLNDVGTLIWNELAMRRTGNELCEAVAREFEIDEVTCRSDVAALLSSLVERNLVRAGTAAA